MWSARLAWQIEFDPDALKELKKLDKPVRERIVGFLKTRVATSKHPTDLGERLSGDQLGKYWKYRLGDWRVICEIIEKRVVVRLLRIGHRGAVYKSN
jgi:mRNA interferase RelE/StbE